MDSVQSTGVYVHVVSPVYLRRAVKPVVCDSFVRVSLLSFPCFIVRPICKQFNYHFIFHRLPNCIVSSECCYLYLAQDEMFLLRGVCMSIIDMYTTNKCYSLLVFYRRFVVPPYQWKKSDTMPYNLKFHTRWVKRQELFELMNKEHISTWTATGDTTRDHVSMWKIYLGSLYAIIYTV